MTIFIIKLDTRVKKKKKHKLARARDEKSIETLVIKNASKLSITVSDLRG